MAGGSATPFVAVSCSCLRHPLRGGGSSRVKELAEGMDDYSAGSNDASTATCSVPVAAPPRRLSQILRQIAGDAQGPVTIAAIRDALGDRSFAALLVVFAAINLLPLPPGTTIVLGPPLLIVSAQMLLGHDSVWLPRFILRKSIGPNRFRQLSKRLLPRLEWLEQVVRPRRWPFARDAADRVIGLVAFILSLAVTLPIPFGNWLPALAIALLALALSERDGILLGVGLLVGLLSFGVIFVVVGAAGVLAGAMFGVGI